MSNAYFYIPHMNRMMRDVTNVVGMYAVLLLHTLGIDTPRYTTDTKKI